MSPHNHTLHNQSPVDRVVGMACRETAENPEIAKGGVQRFVTLTFPSSYMYVEN